MFFQQLGITSASKNPVEKDIDEKETETSGKKRFTLMEMMTANIYYLLCVGHYTKNLVNVIAFNP